MTIDPSYTSTASDKDADIVQKLMARDETALALVMQRYGRLLTDLAMRVCGCHSDAEECVNDALLDLWQTIPPNSPPILLSYISVLTRRRAIDKVRYYTAERRAGSTYFDTLEELEFCLPDHASASEMDDFLIKDCLQTFISRLGKTDKTMFTLRYFRFFENGEIAQVLGMREAAVASRLYRLRKKLKQTLSQNGIEV